MNEKKYVDNIIMFIENGDLNNAHREVYKLKKYRIEYNLEQNKINDISGWNNHKRLSNLEKELEELNNTLEKDKIKNAFIEN